jgi:predicted nucleotide-binding protein
MDTHSIFIRINRRDIAYFKFIVESHEGIAVVRTKDPREAILELMVAPGCEREVEEVIEVLRKEISIEKL